MMLRWELSQEYDETCNVLKKKNGGNHIFFNYPKGD